ncbi:MAG: helix-turn-helix domain-containing protein [Flavisolibacter sp.]
MRPKRENIIYQKEVRSFTCFRLKKPQFEFYWHFHPELELTYILSGSGTRLVGDSIEAFGPGDLVLSGAGLPHTWVSDKKQKRKCEAIVLQFPGDTLVQLESLPEFDRFKQLIKNSASGIHFSKEVAKKYERLFSKIETQKGDTSFLKLLEILCGLAKEKYRLLSHAKVHNNYSQQDTARVNKVLQLIEKNYEEKITIGEVASLVHLSKSAFCKFFKRHVGKNFTKYLNEVRINRACFLLLHTDVSIKEIAYRTGFENSSYFNRIFLSLMEVQPSQYRLRNA